MAKVQKLVILNPADKTRHYSVAMGEGAIEDVDDVIVEDIKQFPKGSQFTNVAATATKVFYVRIAENKAVADWKVINPVA
jgi:hypothetical protein